MASAFTRFLNGAIQGLTNPKGQMGDWRHATRLYVDNTFALAPKTKFSYHVYFDIDPNTLLAPEFAKAHQQEAGLLAKAVDLPNFTFESEVKNQYNRKMVVYKGINYEPINITLHDDNTGVVNALWALYYGYYIRDRHNASVRNGVLNFKGAKNQRSYDPNPYQKATDDFYRYGLDNDRNEYQFFRSITVYTMGRRRFNSYTLINPKIVTWRHGQMDQRESNGVAESSMTVAYEGVVYGSGAVRKGRNPKGFADLHYDPIPSPLSIQGGGTGTVFGSGGILDGFLTIFGAENGEGMFDSPENFLQSAIAAVNTYKSIRNLTKEGIRAEALNFLLTPGSISSTVNTVSGIAGSLFPRGDAGSGIQAQQRNRGSQ